MKIRAKTSFGTVVTIIAFVVKYDATYAVTIRANGTLWDYPIGDLTVLENDMK